MKKLILFFAAVAMIGCSDDDSSSSQGGTSFSLDGTTFQLPPTMGMTKITMEEVTEYNGDLYDRSTISVTGLNGTSSSATVGFDLYYKTGTSVAGTYQIYDGDIENPVDFEEFLLEEDKACHGWTSAGVIFSMGGGDTVNANNPIGTVEVIVNSPTNYTLKFSGNFRQYDDDFNVERMVPANINVTSDVTEN